MKFLENFHPPPPKQVMCHMSHVTSHMSYFFLLFSGQSGEALISVEGLLSTEPTPSSIYWDKIHPFSKIAVTFEQIMQFDVL